jgi:hypothetical protein
MNKSKNVDTIETVDLPLTNQVINVLVENKEAGLIIASSIGTAIIIYVLAKSVAEIIKAFRNFDK